MPTMTFERQTFIVSRALSFFSEPELTRQIGHPRAAWPLVLVKELTDNGLDACENVDCAPQIDVIVTPDAFLDSDLGRWYATLDWPEPSGAAREAMQHEP